jgi:hypothetical protein
MHVSHGIRDGWDMNWARRRLGGEARCGERTGAGMDTLDGIGDLVDAQKYKPSSSPSLLVSHSGRAERVGQGDKERRRGGWGCGERVRCFVKR